MLDAPAIPYEYVVEIEKPVPAAIKQRAQQMMDQLQGWCSYAKASVLIDLILDARPKLVVEIGVFGGKSLVPMAYALQANGRGKIIGIDPWEALESVKYMTAENNQSWWSALDYEKIRVDLEHKIQEFELENQIDLLVTTSELADPIENIDLLHIDGNHCEETSFFDVNKWVPLVKSGGWIVFDDITWKEGDVSTTARAVNWLNEHCIKFAEYTDSCTWGIWVKPSTTPP